MAKTLATVLAACSALAAAADTIAKWQWREGVGTSVTNMADWFDAANWVDGVPVNGTDHVAYFTNSFSGVRYVKISSAIAFRQYIALSSAGNYGWDNDLYPFYPTSYPESNIIAVAATDHNDALAGFSHYGAASVDLGAPGVNVYSTVPGGYGTKSGTSMAAPQVAGVAALLAGLSPAADGACIRRALFKGVDPLPALAGRTVTGGRLNAYKAIRALAWIEHTPLGDTYETNAPYAVDATIMSSARRAPSLSRTNFDRPNTALRQNT